MPELDKGFRVEADASNFATGGVLSIKCKGNMWKPVAYISKSLNKTELSQTSFGHNSMDTCTIPTV